MKKYKYTYTHIYINFFFVMATHMAYGGSQARD